MTERKPAGVSWESWIDRQIREAQERGDFDNLPGKGKPIAGLDEPYDAMWWVRQKLREEGISFTPPTIAVRKALDEALDQIARAESEATVRRIVTDINAQIRAANAKATSGPASSLMPLDVERVVARWAAQRPA